MSAVTPRVLPSYTGNRAVCVKCGAQSGQPQRHRTEWIPPSMFSVCGHLGECLERRCFRCGYTWPEALAGHKDAP